MFKKKKNSNPAGRPPPLNYVVSIGAIDVGNMKLDGFAELLSSGSLINWATIDVGERAVMREAGREQPVSAEWEEFQRWKKQREANETPQPEIARATRLIDVE